MIVVVTEQAADRLTAEITGNMVRELSVEKPNIFAEANDIEKPQGERAPVHRPIR